MSSGIKDGIAIGTEQYGSDESLGIPTYLRIIQLLAIIFGTWSFLSIFIESFSIHVSYFHLNIAMVISSIVFYFIFLFPSYGLVKAFFIILFYGLFGYSRLPKLQNAFYILENLAINQINDYYEIQLLYYKADYTTAERDITLFLILLVIPLAALLAATIVSKRITKITFIVLTMPIIASFSVGIIPSEIYLITTILVVIFLLKTNGTRKHGKDSPQAQLHTKIGMKVATILCGICLLLFFIMKLLVSPTDYDNRNEVKIAKYKIQDFLFNLSIEDVTASLDKLKISNKKVAPGGLSEGQLGRVDQVSFTDSEHLRIRLPLPSAYEGLYLKGYVGSVYTGDSWEEGDKEIAKKYETLQEIIPLEKFSPMNQVSMLLEQIATTKSNGGSGEEYQFLKGTIKITYADANKNHLYLPYFTKYDTLDKIAYKQDLYVVPTVKSNQYELDYYFDISIGDQSSTFFDAHLPEKLIEYSQYEKEYRKYVYDLYTLLPEDGLIRLKEEFSLEKSDKEFKSISEKIMYTKNYLNDNTQYSLSPGKLPKDKDFVEYFLYENQVGYCAHYASAATLMLRAMGIPARYVEGYAVGRDEIVQADYLEDQMITEYSNSADYFYSVRQLELSVRDYNAHSWVEVYIDNCGWIPVEFTPGSAIEYTDDMVEGMALIGDEMNQYEEEIAPIITPEAPTPTPTKQEENDEEEIAKPTITPRQDKVGEKDRAGVKDSDKNNTIWIFIVVIVVVLASIITGIIIPFIVKKSQIRKSNRNQKALFIYKEIEKVISSTKGFLKGRERLEDHIDFVKTNYPYLREEEFETCIEIIQKARFGRHIISNKELKKVINFYDKLFKTTYENASLGKKLYLKLRLLL